MPFNQKAFYGVDGDTPSMGRAVAPRRTGAPECRQRCEWAGRDWSCGGQAKEGLVSLLQCSQVECSGSDRDRNGGLRQRVLATSWKFTAKGTWRSTTAPAGPREGLAKEAGLWAGRFERWQDFRNEEQAADADGIDPPAAVGWYLRKFMAGF
jgi:endonuclease YncB( thermonuclease family)